MNRHDPVQGAIEQLPDEPLSEETAARIGRNARATFVRMGSPLARFDDLTFGRVVPVLLLGCSLLYVLGLVSFLGATY